MTATSGVAGSREEERVIDREVTVQVPAYSVRLVTLNIYPRTQSATVSGDARGTITASLEPDVELTSTTRELG
ncbi:hypothetical protein ACSNOI_03330 [Actinomadura kijaniata]|uniref:hypothetical protein n=1 Tax=Actinomadura kijaniata TaxID=46161 RepID=UPI003F199F34